MYRYRQTPKYKSLILLRVTCTYPSKIGKWGVLDLSPVGRYSRIHTFEKYRIVLSSDNLVLKICTRQVPLKSIKRLYTSSVLTFWASRGRIRLVIHEYPRVARQEKLWRQSSHNYQLFKMARRRQAGRIRPYERDADDSTAILGASIPVQDVHSQEVRNTEQRGLDLKSKRNYRNFPKRNGPVRIHSTGRTYMTWSTQASMWAWWRHSWRIRR